MSKRVFITGGASGLGRALAAHYVRGGWRVLIGDIDEERGGETASALDSHGDIEFRRLDVRSEEDFIEARSWLEKNWGGLDVLYNNAGVAGMGRFERIPLEDWHWMLDICLMGVVRGCREFAPLFKTQGHGHIVNIASMAGLLNPPIMTNYNVAKAGVVSLSETLRYELEPYGVYTTVACPSFFETNLPDSIRTPDPELAERMKKLLTRSELTADDVARLIAEAVAQRRFMALPHKSARRTWRFKRYIPALVNRQMRKLGQHYKRKFS